MIFQSDPTPLVKQLDSAWAEYTKGFQQHIQKVLASIVSWRWATGDMFPVHPLFGLADTTPDHEPWRPFTRHWLRDNDPKANLRDAWRHGFDSKGRIVLVHNQVWGNATVWRKGCCDRLRIYESSEEAGHFVWGLPHQDRVEFTRFWHDGDDRIECLCSYLRENDTHFRLFEWFEYEGKRCVESVRQWFEIMTEIPFYHQESSEKELRENYRSLKGKDLLHNLVETMYMRRRVKYSYRPSGELLKAEEFKGDGTPQEELLFKSLPQRSLEETTELLADKTADAILKAVKKRSPAKPYRGLALIYSAEHAHCGLPHQVSVLADESPWPKPRFDHEAYPDKLEVVFKRPISNLLTEFNQRCDARFALDSFDEQTAVVVEVMRKIAEQLHQALAGTKHVTDDFAVLLIDDHGDVKSFAVPD